MLTKILVPLDGSSLAGRALLYAQVLARSTNAALILVRTAIWRLARLPAAEPHLVGPAARIGALPAARQRLVVAALVLGTAVDILLVAEPFATALVETGVARGFDPFQFVQWLAPLASEGPRFVVASIFAWRGLAGAARSALLSSKIDQWTLLVAMLPIIYGIALGKPEPLPPDARQQREIWLTAAQSFFAVVLLLDLRLSLAGAGTLFTLFAVQFTWPDTYTLLTVLYLALGLFMVFLTRGSLGNVLRSARAATGGHQ